MSFTFSTITDLAKFYGMTVDQVKEKTYKELEAMEEAMKKRQTEEQITKNRQSPEYTRLIEKYLTIYPLLSHYFEKDDIIAACTRHMPIYKLISELKVKHGRFVGHPDAEFIETRYDYIPRYTKSGEQLMEPERCHCDIYRVRNQYQHTNHGEIVLELLYQKHPQLKAFDFHAYGLCCEDENKYELYPDNNIYTPFAALMEKDVDAIIKRNRDYARSYNHGIYTVEETEKRLQSDKVQHYFDAIRNL